MTYTLRNKDLEIKIDHPLSNYQASRFDWTGKISEVKYLGIPLTITEKPNGEDENLFGKGLYNEFGIDTALGFDDTEVGGWFHKIGVGLLKKEGNEYKFSHPHEVKPAQFEVVAEVDQIKIRCISDIYNGFGYELNKSIILRENQLMLQYELKNLGEKEITSDEYSHNFIAINRSHLNGSYKLNMPFNIKPDEFLFTVEPEDVIRYNNSSITFESNLKEQFLLSHIGGSNAKTATWEMIHQDEKIGLREEGSFPTEKINIWGWGHVISPELFHQIKLSSGETERWFRTYHFFQVN